MVTHESVANGMLSVLYAGCKTMHVRLYVEVGLAGRVVDIAWFWAKFARGAADSSE